MGEFVDQRAIAARIREILGGHDGPRIAQGALRLRVSEAALQSAIRDADPEPDIAVLIAVVREYGVDPMWLITGTYDLETHRTAIDDEAEQATDALKQIISRHLTPPQGQRAADPVAPPLPLPEVPPPPQLSA